MPDLQERSFLDRSCFITRQGRLSQRLFTEYQKHNIRRSELEYKNGNLRIRISEYECKKFFV